MGKIVDGVYYDSNGNPTFAGIVESDEKFYYAAEEGKIIKGRSKIVRSAMSNNLVKHGTYYFDENGVLVSSSYKKPHRITNKRKKTDKKTKIKATALVAASVIVLTCILLSFFTNTHPYGSKKANTSGIAVSVPEYEDEVYLCSKQAELYYKGEITLQQALQSAQTPYAPFVFKYEIKNADSAVLLLGEKSNLSDGVEYVLDVREKSMSIYNLKTATKYYFKVAASGKDKESKEATGSFKTANTNRFISLPGIYNTRDIGGYETENNKRIKQGLLIRGTEADGLVESTYYLTDPKAAEPFGFVCDFDLRNNNIFNTNYVSRFGSQVTHKFYNSPQYGGIFAKGEEETLRQIFSDLADRRNYPMYLHCTYGADRTGTVVFLLQGLLGVSEEDMLKEYSLTGFVFKDYADSKRIQSIYAGLEGVPGKDINEKIYNYMVETIGVTPKQIEEIRAIFLEQVP